MTRRVLEHEEAARVFEHASKVAKGTLQLLRISDVLQHRHAHHQVEITIWAIELVRRGDAVLHSRVRLGHVDHRGRDVHAQDLRALLRHPDRPRADTAADVEHELSGLDRAHARERSPAQRLLVHLVPRVEVAAGKAAVLDRALLPVLAVRRGHAITASPGWV